VPTRKQKRRRAKLDRHEYETVWVDDEGHEVEVDEEEAAPAARPARAAKNGRAAPATTRGLKTPQPPSWRRLGKRAAIFLPLIFLTISFLPGGRDLTTTQRVAQTVFLVLLILPVWYLMDSFTYRLYQRRTGGDAGRR
jgi:hypothetical protein